MQAVKRQRKGSLWIVLLLIGVLTCVGTPRAVIAGSDDDSLSEQDDQEEWRIPARVDSQIRASRDRTLNITEYWRPLWQSPDRVIFGTARIMGDNQSNFEGSLGVGGRGFYTDHI